MIKIGKVIGDVIEAGGVKNVTNNYYGRERSWPRWCRATRRCPRRCARSRLRR